MFCTWYHNIVCRDKLWYSQKISNQRNMMLYWCYVKISTSRNCIHRLRRWAVDHMLDTKLSLNFKKTGKKKRKEKKKTSKSFRLDFHKCCHYLELLRTNGISINFWAHYCLHKTDSTLLLFFCQLQFMIFMF